jgi:TP901 family phage tail tape measure protein
VTDNKVEIEVGIEASLSGLINRVLSNGVADAAKIEASLNGALKDLQAMQAASKKMGVLTGAMSRGTATSQIINGGTSGQAANARADRTLADILTRVSNQLVPGASEAALKRAFREALISEGRLTRGPNTGARGYAEETLDPMFRQAKAGLIAERNARLNADFDRAQRENRARDYVEHRRTRLNGERFEDNSIRANAAHDDRVRTRALKQLEREEGWARDSLMADAKHDDRMRTTAIKQAEKEAGHRDANLLRAAQWEDSQRLKAEARAQKYAASMLRAGDLNGMLARGNTDGATALLQRARGTLSGRPGVDDQFINGLLRQAEGKVDASKAIQNIKAAEAELRSLFAGINKFATAAERQEILGNGARDIASRRGLNPNVLDRTADDLEGVRGTRDRVLGMPVRPEPRPQRAPGRGSSMLGRLGGRMELFADYAGISAIVGTVGYTVSQVALLEKSLATLKSISGATDGQMQSLSETIKEIGQNSTYSLTEISAAATTLAQAGYTVGQVAAVLPDITNLALASGSDLQTSTDIVSSVLTVFDMNLRESGYVADALVQALNGSKLSMDQFALGMQYAGNAAAQGGVSFEDLAAALGAMSNAGIRSGSTLGTGLTAVFQELMAPTQKLRDHLQEQGVAMSAVDLQTHGLVEVLNTLQDAQIDSSKGFELFDTRAARAYSALVNNKTILEQLSTNFDENGAAAAAAAVQMDTLLAQLNRLGNATVQFTEVFGAPIINVLKNAMGGLADFLVTLASASPLVRALTAAGVTLGIGLLVVQARAASATFSLVALNAALAPLRFSFAIGGAAAAFSTALTLVAGGFMAATRAALAFTASLLLNPFAWLAVGIAGLVGAITYFSGATERAKNAADKFKEAAAQERAEVDELTTTIDELNKFTADLADRQGDTNSAVDEAVRKFAKYGFELDNTITKTEDLAAATRGFSEELAALRLERAQAEQAALNEQNAALQGVARGNLGAAGRALSLGVMSRADRAAGAGYQNSSQWKAAMEGGVTSTELRALINYLTQRKNDDGMTPQLLANLNKAITSLEANGLPLSLSDLSRNQIMAGVTGTDAAIATSPTFQGYGTRMSTRRAGWLAAMDNGELSVEDQRDFRVRAEPAMRADISSTAGTIVSELETSRGTPYSAQERQELLATILVKLRENADFAAMLEAYDSNPDYWNDTRITRELSDLEGQQRSASTAARPGILTRIEALKKTQLGRRSDTTSEQDAGDLASYMSGLDTNVGVRQGARSADRALAQNATNARREAQLAAERLNTGMGGPSGTWMRPINAAEGSPFGATAGRTGPHRGSDYPAGVGTQVVAPMGGMASSGFSEANGNFVRIDHGNGFESVLIHLNEAAAGLSAVAKQVEQGEEVGRSGNTGASRGPHLHWQLKLNGEVVDPETMVGQAAIDTAAEIISAAQTSFDEKWVAYETARWAEFDDRTSEMTSEEQAGERTAQMNDLALEKAELLKQGLDKVYATILDNFEIQASDAVASALGAAARGDEGAGNAERLARAAIIRQRDAAVDAARASMEDGDAEEAAVRAIMREYATRLSGLTVGMLEASANYVSRQAEREARNRGVEFSIRQGVIDARSNPNAQRNGSRALDIIRGRDPERLAEDRQREEVRIARSNDDAARRAVSNAQTALQAEGLSPDETNQLQTTLQAAQDAAFGTALSLKEANLSLQSMTAEAETFKTPMDAIRGGWEAFIEQANLGRPVLSTLADGLLESFKGAKEGFKTLIVDVLSGTKSMGDAFKDLAVSILGSLLDLAAEILAQQLLTMIITSLIPGGFGKGAGGTPGLTPVASAGKGFKYQGGMIPRRAAGGMAPSPNRDSVMTFMQPGEFVMSKTATDFIGADTLSEMNASGNRRMKNLPTVASSMPKRVPDEVNVWVVPPSQRPPMGKKDIIAAVTDDMMMNGQTKRLIKAIQVGAM